MFGLNLVDVIKVWGKFKIILASGMKIPKYFDLSGLNWKIQFLKANSAYLT